MGDSGEIKKTSPLRHADSLLTEEERQRELAVARERMVMLNGCLYGLESDTEPDAFCDCLTKLDVCRALCCTYFFALTQEEVHRGIVAHNPERPYYIARDPDGYCPHFDRLTYICLIHDYRPLRCRRYKCAL
ncbi:MAG: hypothetical protein FD164_2228 [Nitrospirae bacterium]|nr:MAG: hypothetical protein FD164_2228 [Nitrospirota bacterium]